MLSRSLTTRAQVVPALNNLHGEELLKELTKRWDNHQVHLFALRLHLSSLHSSVSVPSLSSHTY